MATQDTSEEDTQHLSENEDLDTSQEEDETSEDDNEESTDESEDSDDTDDSEDEEEEDSDSETDDEDEAFEKRFTQFKGDSYKEYTPQLEKAYGESLAEMTRLKQSAKETTSQLDLIRQAAQKDGDFAKKLDEVLDGNAESVTVDPALLQARQDLQERMDKEYKDFVDLHPEMESDPTRAEKVLEVLTDFGAQSRKQGKIMSMSEALRKAWTFLGYDKEETAEKTIAKAKENASKSKTGNKAKKTTTSKEKYTAEQKAYAKKWGLSLDD